MRTPALTLALLLSPLAANADPAADYERLVTVLPGLSFNGDAEDQAKAVKASLPGLEGRWIEGQVLRVGQEDGFVFPDAERLAELCGKASVQLTPVGELGLDLTREAKSGSVTFHLQWVAGSTFLSHVDEGEFLTFIFGKDYQGNDLLPVYRTLGQTPWLGEFSLMPVSSDLILLQFPRGPAEMLVRCPA